MNTAATTKTSLTQASSQESINNRLMPLRSMIYNALMIRIDPNTAVQMTPGELQQETEDFVVQFVNSQGVQLNRREQKQVATDIVNDMIGFGPLEQLLSDDSVTDIMVNGPEMVYVERQGKIEKTWVTFRDHAHIMQIAQRIANRIGRRIDEASPMVDARLPDGSRINIITPPVSLNGPVLSIRKFSRRSIDINLMVKQKNLSAKMAEFLQIATTCRLNTLVSGGTGSGKTTLLNALSEMINPRERIVTIEDAAELRLKQPHVVRLEMRPPNVEGEGAISIRDLLKNALRMRPDRIIVGEVRGEETIDMLQAMNTGHDGSMSTIHANRATDALLRLENMITMSDSGVPGKVIQAQIAGGVDMIVQIERMRDGIRRINEIIEVVGLEGDKIKTQTVFEFAYSGEDKNGRLTGDYVPREGVIPTFMEKARYFGLDQKLAQIMGLS
ncbi:MAG: CpaF family protein [Alphaproteobacteria bacterium]|jgi:pilus assembly protein CpaF|nr:CpaF family protein [Alphaproteobacteria bacterium]